MARGETSQVSNRYRGIFLNRRHFRLAAEFRAAELDTPRDSAAGAIGAIGPDVKPRFEKIQQHVIDLFGQEAIICDVADHSATKMHQVGNKLWVVIDQKTRYLGEVSEVVGGMSRRVWRARIYCPAEIRERVVDCARQCQAQLLGESKREEAT